MLLTRAAAYAAAGAVVAADAGAAAQESLKIVNLSAQIALEALIKLESPGCKYLYLIDTD